MQTEKIVKLLGDWSLGRGALYQRLAGAFKVAIKHRLIGEGDSLPPERQLAIALSISRSTVIKAYRQLKDENWAASRRGSGTRINTLKANEIAAIKTTTAARIARPALYEQFDGNAFELIDFSVSSPAMPVQLTETIQAAVSQLGGDRMYYPLGLPELREAVAVYLTAQGVSTNSEQILITTGAQQAISLISEFYLERGDRVVIENPTYFGALDAFRQREAKLVTFEQTGEGIALDSFERAVKAASPRFVYLTAACQNPTGYVIKKAERVVIKQICEQTGTPLISDETLIDLILPPNKGRTLADSDEKGNTIVLGSLSKVVWAGLRIGWIRAAENVISQLSERKIVADLGSSLISQAVALDIFPHLETIKAERRQELSSKRDVLSVLLKTNLPDWQWQTPQGGFFLWITIPEGDAKAFSQLAQRHGVAVTPGASMSVYNSHKRNLRMTFSLDLESLESGIQRLASAWSRYQPS